MPWFKGFFLLYARCILKHSCRVFTRQTFEKYCSPKRKLENAFEIRKRIVHWQPSRVTPDFFLAPDSIFFSIFQNFWDFSKFQKSQVMNEQFEMRNGGSVFRESAPPHSPHNPSKFENWNVPSPAWEKRSGINLRQIPCSAGLSFRIINNACRLWTASITHSRLKRQLVLENKSSIGDVWWKEGEPPEAWAQAWALSLDVDGRFQYDLIWLRLDLFVYSLHL